MKTNFIKTLVLGVALSLITNIGMLANGPETVPVKSKIAQINNSLSFNVWVENLAKKKVMVLVLDKDGIEFYREYVNEKTDKFAKTFDLSNLSDGTYSISVIAQNRDIVETKTFNIKTSVVESRKVEIAGL
jgi:hypothetical protein